MILKREEDGISSERLGGSGKPSKNNDQKEFVRKYGISQQKAARKMRCPQSLIYWILKSK